MIRSQVVVLNVIYGEIDEDWNPKNPPAEWDWDSLVDEPIKGAVEVLAAGPVKHYPRPGEEEE